MGTFTQFSKRVVEESVDNYIAKIANKNREIRYNHRSPTVDPGIDPHNPLKSKYEGPNGIGFDDQEHSMSEDYQRGLDLQPYSDGSDNHYK